ncbi:conserved hypothetical protein [Candidatus Sulfobium mesophilum]|uniref:Bacterial Ig-like domain-containing protein n=1 Tax=Candidatus Sulfobium mesophilum TaxID=2016548 RepID=A0A2U3QDP9_9BACT|nr:conserved hypothetical protein [Candidatus Sulfobium mesophilum]
MKIPWARRNKSFMGTLTGKELFGNYRKVMKKIVAPVLFLIASASLLVTAVVPGGTGQGSGEPLKVEIFTITKGQKVRGAISIGARVNHPEEVNFIEFYFQEPGAEDRYSWKAYAPPYFWGGEGQTLDTTLFDDGPVSAVAFCFPKAKGAVMVQHRVHFVIDNGKPKVKILSPKDGATVNQNVTIEVDASDPGGIRKNAGIVTVSLYLDGGLFQSLTKSPFRVVLSTCLLDPGLHSIRAVAEDTDGMTSAHAVMINVVGGGSGG